MKRTVHTMKWILNHCNENFGYKNSEFCFNTFMMTYCGKEVEWDGRNINNDTESNYVWEDWMFKSITQKRKVRTWEWFQNHCEGSIFSIHLKEDDELFFGEPKVSFIIPYMSSFCGKTVTWDLVTGYIKEYAGFKWQEWMFEPLEVQRLSGS
jgi:hypothetical protein